MMALSAVQRRRWWLVAVAGIVLAVGIGLVRWRWNASRLNVILFTFDTTRADHLGCYGYEHGLTKAFDDFARQGVVFERVYAPTPLTLPSHTTMLTGLYPPEHGLRANGNGRLDGKVPLLPEILQAHGYDTGAFIAAEVLDSKYGLARGFETYNFDKPVKKMPKIMTELRRDGQDVVDSALAWLRQRTNRPFFCWIHFFDAHSPYDSRAEDFGQTFEDLPYDAGIAWEIRQFERVMAYLKDRKFDANTLVVVVGDHGEGLGEHLELEHGMLLYNSTLQVPLIFVGPRVCQPGTRVPDPVSLVDLTPTVLDVLRLPAPRHVSGRSLSAALMGRPIEPRDCYAETEIPFLYNDWSPLQALISQRWKYIQTTRPELYDLEQDPQELTNLFGSGGPEVQRLQDRLQALQEKFVVIANPSNQNLSEKDLANLQALGYMAAGNRVAGEHVPDRDEALPDVKDFLPQVAKFEKAKYLGLEGKVDESIALLEEIVQTTDKFPTAELLLGDCLAQAGRLDQAEQTFRLVLSRRPDYVRVHLTLGKILAGQGRLEEAVAELQEASNNNPESAAIHFELAQVLTQLKKFDEAVLEYREAVRLAPEMVSGNLALGQLLMMLQRPNEAVASFEQALAYNPNLGPAHANLLAILAQTGQFGKALEHGKQAVALEPKSFEHRFNLGLVLVSLGRYSEGIAQLQQAQQLRPEDPRPREQIQRAEAVMRQGRR